MAMKRFLVMKSSNDYQVLWLSGLRYFTNAINQRKKSIHSNPKERVALACRSGGATSSK